MKPKIFIGSSVEGLPIAEAIQSNLDHFGMITVWNQGVFSLAISAMDSLLKALESFDYAIFVFSPDDFVQTREQSTKAVRSNVIFETGLFAGKMGMKNVFFVRPRGEDMHLPSDLDGLIYGDYASDNENLQSATGKFCSAVKIQIIQLEKDQNKLPSKPLDIIESGFNILNIYMADKGWKSISFEKIEANVDPRLNQMVMTEILDAFPKEIRRAKLGTGRFGITLLEPKITDG